MLRDTSTFSPAVAVPARNEEKRLPILIDALAKQTWLQRGERRLKVVIVLDNCIDRSRHVAEVAAAAHPKLSVHLVDSTRASQHSHVGAARRQAMDCALQTGSLPERTVLLTTDADAVPASNWVDANLDAIDRGIHLVGGEIIGDCDEERLLGAGFLRRAGLVSAHAAAADRLASLLDPLPHDPWPRHRDHTGASLAVRGDVYHKVGGMPAVAHREDLTFVSRVRAAGYLLQHPRSVQVKVSARLDGRAAGGMADCLHSWILAEQNGEPILVEAPGAIARRAQLRALLRAVNDDASFTKLAPVLGCDLEKFRNAQRRYLSPAALVEAIAPDEPDAPKTVLVEVAILEIMAMIEAVEMQSLAA